MGGSRQEDNGSPSSPPKDLLARMSDSPHFSPISSESGLSRSLNSATSCEMYTGLVTFFFCTLSKASDGSAVTSSRYEGVGDGERDEDGDGAS
jgi:hypothetical protein